MFLARPIERRPNGLTDKKPHGMNPIRLVHGKPMINPLGQRHQIPRLDMDANPSILLIPHVEESGTPQYVPYLLRVVDVLLEEGLDLRVVLGKSVGMDGDDVGVGVAAIVAEFGEAGIDGVLGIPGDGDFGIFVGGGIELPVA